MPIYEYKCSHCNSQFEFLVRSNERPVCPECRGSDIEKQLSVIASPANKEGSVGPLPLPGGGCGLPRCGTGGCQP